MIYTANCRKNPEGTDPQGNPEEIESRPALKTLIGKPNLVGLEIGVRFGCNALRIFNFLDIKKLYLIDKRKLPETDINLKLYKDNILWLVGDSKNMHVHVPNNSLDFVYIDGGHTYEIVKSDIIKYFSKVKEDGMISGHDYKPVAAGLAVMKAVHEIFGTCNSQPPYWDWWVYKKDYQMMEIKNG